MVELLFATGDVAETLPLPEEVVETGPVDDAVLESSPKPTLRDKLTRGPPVDVVVAGAVELVEFALLLMLALTEELVVEAAEEDELLVLPVGSASEPALEVEAAGAVELALLLI